MASEVRLDLPDSAGSAVGFRDWLRGLRLRDFCLLYGHMWNSVALRSDPWELWPGVRGYPGQPEMLDAIESAQILWLLKTRQIAGTTGSALQMTKIGLTEDRAAMLVFNKDMPTAKKVLEEKVKFHLDSLLAIRAPDGGSLPWPRWDVGKEVIEFEGGATIEAKPSTSSGAISRAPRYQLWDEVREYEGDSAEEMYASNLPVLHGAAQLAIVSTNKPGTWYSKMSQIAVQDWRSITGTAQVQGYDETGRALDRGGPAVRLRVMPKVTFMFMPYDVCPERRTPGWVDEWRGTFQDDAKFFREYPRCPEDVFLTREGLVLPSFGERNLVSHSVINWESSDELWLLYDHGRSEDHPALCWFVWFRPRTNHAHTFDEVYANEDPELPDVARSIMDKLEYWWSNGAPGVHRAVGDVTGKEFSRRQQLTKSIAECLEEEMGIHWEPASKQDKEGSLEAARSRVHHGKFTIDPKRCPSSVKQLKDIKFKDGTDMPSEKMDEALDLLRYGSHEWAAVTPAAPRTPLQSLLARAARKEESRLGGGLNAQLGPWLGQSEGWGVAEPAQSAPRTGVTFFP